MAQSEKVQPQTGNNLGLSAYNKCTMASNHNNRKRAYLNQPNKLPEIPLDFRYLAGQGADLTEMFSALTRELRKKYAIHKGVLVLRNENNHRLAAVTTWNNGAVRDGLTVNLPPESSLFEKVAEHGSVYTEDFCDAFSGNFFERKLLLENESRSFVVQPLKIDGEVVGLIGYSSEEPTAFAMFEEGAGEKVAADLAEIILDFRDNT